VAWTGVYDVPYLQNPPATFYQKWFWLVPSLLWGALAVMLGLGFRKR
jgi:apolipoprotein N-acyltransferase